jgi:predicted O-linked N-acetylglucosamine transferase (SPINDLY family)
LSRAGHPEWVATSPEGYVAAAVALAADLGRLVWLRSELRWKLSSGALGDVTGLARALEAAYRGMLHAVAGER